MRLEQQELTMPISLEEYRRRFPDRPEPVGLEHAGKWIAVKDDLRTILSSGDDPIEVRQSAISQGYENPILRFVPPTAYIG
jgi:hypothetical protein